MAEQQIEPFAYQKSTNIDEHNQIVDKLNEVVAKINDTNMDTINAEVATLKANVATNTSDIDSLADTVDAQATSIATNKTNIESLRDANILITKDIESIKETDTEQNASITALGNADIATVDSSFDTDTRDLKISLNPVSGSAIETTVNIPGGSGTADVTGTAPITVSNNNVGLNINTSTLKVDDNGQLTVIGGGGGGGGDYSATLPITIADNAIGIAYDDTLVLKDNKLSVVNTGTDYVAGTGITIDNATIAVDDTVVATKASVDAMGITVSEHSNDIASLEQKYDSQSTAITELSTGVSNAISTANTANDTATDANTNVKDCYNSVSISDNVVTFGTVDGESKDITIPTSGDGWVDVDLSTFSYNDFNVGDEMEVEFKVRPSFTCTSWTGTISNPKFETFTSSPYQSQTVRFYIRESSSSNNTQHYIPFTTLCSNYAVGIGVLFVSPTPNYMKEYPKGIVFSILLYTFNGANAQTTTLLIYQPQLSTYVKSIRVRHV